MSKEKYKMFRNYMTNELGITRGDIEAWTKEAVATEVNKLIGQMDFDSKVQSALQATAREAVNGTRFGSGQKLRDAIAKQFSEKLVLTIKE